MKRTSLLWTLLLAAVAIAPLQAADPTPTVLTPGSYVVNVVPTFNHDMGSRLEKGISGVDGIASVTTRTDDSSIHFTVKEKSQLNLVELQQMVESIDKGAVVTTPVLAHTLSANPGL